MAALLVACGGGDDDDSGETAEPSNPNGEATEAPTTPPDPADVAAPAPVGLGAPLGMPSVQQGASLIGSVQALAASGAGDAIYYRLSLGSNTEAYDSVALTIEYGTASIDFAALSLGVDPSAIQDICAAGETSCQVDDAAGVVSVTGLQPLRGRVFTEANDEQLQPGEALDYIIAFAISGDASAGTVVQVSVAAAGVNGEDALAPMGEGFVFEPGQWGIEGSFPGDVPQIEDTVSPRVFLANATGQSMQNVAFSYIASQPPGLEFLTGSCNTDVQATLPFGDLPTIATLTDLEFCFTNENFGSGRQLQLEASLKAADPVALAAGVRILLAARGKDGNGFVHISELVEITR
jgi:hypothetical protein